MALFPTRRGLAGFHRPRMPPGRLEPPLGGAFRLPAGSVLPGLVPLGLALAGLVLLLAGCSANGTRPGEGSDALEPGTHTITLRHAGLQRRYHVHVPPAAASRRPLPVMLAFHGGGGNGDQFRRTSGLPELAEREGFLAVFPDGSGLAGLLTWNAGSCCSFAMNAGRDDVGFTAAVLDDLARRTPVDPDRVYATGHSNGAMMSYRLAAELGHRIAAIVPVGGAMMLDSFVPSRPVPVLHIHSTDDPRALYEGGEGPPFPGTSSTVVHRPVMEGLEAWVARNGCPAAAVEGRRLTGPTTGPNAGHTAVELRWEPCTSGAPVVHLRLTGVGHGWPGQTRSLLPEGLMGPHTTLVDAAVEAWHFASGFRR